jgi:hypothetical protein
MDEKKHRSPIKHKTEIKINKKKMKAILDCKGLEYMDLYNQIVAQFGLDLSYKGFMSIVAGKATWKLLYAYAVIDVLNVQIMDIFELVEVSDEEVE